MDGSTIRVLVVDDYEPWRRFVRLTLQIDPGLQVVGEASDGLDAVQKAQELQPDLILLDIGLPRLNGIEAALRIRKLSPKTRILFVSQEPSADMVQKAICTGAGGYIVKADAGRELLTALSAVLRGENFVGSRFAGHDFSGASNSQVPEGVRRSKVVAPPQQERMEIPGRHKAGLYSDERCLLDDLTQFIGAALKAGNAAIVVATESHRRCLLPRLHAYGLDIGAAIEQGRYIALDAADTLSTFMFNGMPDPVRFMKAFGSLVLTAAKAAKDGHHRVAVFGECVQLLWTQGNAEAMIQMEKLGNQLAKTYEVDILCGYSLGSFRGGMDSHIFQRIRAEHSAVYSR